MHLFRSAACFFLLTGSIGAQEFRASIGGQVTDSSGAAVAGAAITVTNLERNTSSETVTNSAGRYLVQFLLPGRYTVSAEKAGFKRIQQTGIRLESAHHVALDFSFEVGSHT